MTDTPFFDNSPGDCGAARRRHRPRGDLRPRAAGRASTSTRSSCGRRASRSSPRLAGGLLLAGAPQAGVFSGSWPWRTRLPFCALQRDFQRLRLRAEVALVSSTPRLPPKIVSANFETGTSGIMSKVLRSRPWTVFVAPRRRMSTWPRRSTSRSGRTCCRAPGRPGPFSSLPSSGDVACAKPLTEAFGHWSAASCGRVQSVPMWRWSRISARGRVDAGAAQVRVAVAGDEGRPEFRVVVPEHVLAAAEEPGREARAEAAACGSRWSGTGPRPANELKVAGLVGSAPPPSSAPSVASLPAAGRVDDEVVLVDVDVDRADVELGAAEDVGDRVRRGVDAGRFGVDEQRHPDHDRAEVEGPGDRGGDHRQRERRALIGAGEVGLASIWIGEAPLPALIEAVPTRLLSGQLELFALRRAGAGRPPWRGLSASSRGRPSSLPVRPGGSEMSTPLISCSPSLRVKWTAKGLKAPALTLFEVVEKPGAKGRAAERFRAGAAAGGFGQRERLGRGRVRRFRCRG